jgi:hypothetical protein
MVLDLEKQIGAGIDEEILADRPADRFDPAALQGKRMDALPADCLIFEVAADRAALLERGDIAAALVGIGRIGALEVDL